MGGAEDRVNSFAIAEYHQQHARWLKRLYGMWDICGHSHDGSWDRPDGLAASESQGIQSEETNRFVGYYESMAASSSEVLVSRRLVVH